MNPSKLHKTFLDAALSYELGGNYQRVFILAAAREAGQSKKDLCVMSTASPTQMENLSKLILQQEGLL